MASTPTPSLELLIAELDDFPLVLLKLLPHILDLFLKIINLCLEAFVHILDVFCFVAQIDFLTAEGSNLLFHFFRLCDLTF